MIVAAKLTKIDSKIQRSLAEEELKNLYKNIDNVGVIQILDDAEIEINHVGYKIFIMYKYEKTLSKYLQENKAILNYKVVMTIIMQLIESIRVLHEKGTLHRDLK